MAVKADVYDDYAAEYAAMMAEREGRGIAAEPMMPVLLDLAGDVTGLAVLDAGCGAGYLSRILAARGAQVTGIDIAARLVAHAQAQDPDGTITYLVHDLSRPLPAYTGHFDLIASYFVLNDVADYQGFIATLATLLKPGGRALLALNNPYSYVVRNHVRDYFDSSTPYSYRGMAAEGVKVYFYQHTLGEYLDTFLAAGLQLQRLVDVPTPEWMLQKLPDRLLPPGFQFPFFMVLAFVKPA
jgi:2-polyprenyl-3-methyl-5-hydroxy-6-metoxy-1,4-benzoquinol methylase